MLRSTMAWITNFLRACGSAKVPASKPDLLLPIARKSEKQGVSEQVSE